MNDGDRSTTCRRGEVIGGNYVLGDVLGAGGMGIVHEAVQCSLQRTVAVKVPRTELIHDPLVHERFRAEALAASRFSHQNIVRVLDYGEEHNVPYLVMEHVAGPRLGEVLQAHGRFTIEIAVELVAQIVNGLENAHDHGVVHADVKCDNVLVETLRNGAAYPRLIDFGIAQFEGEPPRTPGESVITGTAEYVAPEVVRGERPTCAADVYGLGVMLYELITGVTPFNGGSVASILCRKLETEAPPMSWQCPELEIPLELDRLVARALARDPGARYANAGELGAALDDLIASGRTLGLSSPPPGRPIFSTRTTAKMNTERIHSRTRTGPITPRAKISDQRLRVVSAIGSADVESTTVAYLELARALLDGGQFAAAVSELEEGIELLSSSSAAPIWRLLLTLAALYDGNGDRDRARNAARAACEQARRIGSKVGCERAEQLCARLAARRASSRRSRPW